MHPVKSHVPESSCEVNIADVFRAHLAKIDAMIRECEEAAGAPTSPAWCEVVEACMIVESMLEMLCMFLRYATVCSFGFIIPGYSRAVQSMAVLYQEWLTMLSGARDGPFGSNGNHPQGRVGSKWLSLKRKHQPWTTPACIFWRSARFENAPRPPAEAVPVSQICPFVSLPATSYQASAPRCGPIFSQATTSKNVCKNHRIVFWPSVFDMTGCGPPWQIKIVKNKMYKVPCFFDALDICEVWANNCNRRTLFAFDLSIGWVWKGTPQNPIVNHHESFSFPIKFIILGICHIFRHTCVNIMQAVLSVFLSLLLIAGENSQHRDARLCVVRAWWAWICHEGLFIADQRPGCRMC